MTHVATHSILIANVSRETSSGLANYVSLLLKWNEKINLIGPATESDIWNRHIDDSLQLLPLIPQTTCTLADLGSGAGLPGIVLSIARPDIKVTLVEQDQRKAAFLNEAKHLMQLSNVTVEAIDLAKLKASYDVVTARALTSLSQLLSYSRPLMKTESIAIFPKGENYAAELTEAQQNWRFDYSLKSSVTNHNSSIVIISNLAESR